MIVAGIDPGISPAYAIVSNIDNGEHVYGRIKEEDHWFDPWALRDILLENRVNMVVTERVGGMAGQGVSSVFRFGYAAATIVGVAVGLGIEVVRVTPQKWKKQILAQYEMGRGEDGVKDVQKKAACQFVKDYYPDVCLRPSKRHKVDDHNIAEAVCLASYGLWLKSERK
jgi:hypothetical protein